jgi:hypothetical protein
LDVDIKDGSLTNVLFVNCEPGMLVSFRLAASQYNIVGSGGHRDYLPVGENELHLMYLVSLRLCACVRVCVCVLCVLCVSRHA